MQEEKDLNKTSTKEKTTRTPEQKRSLFMRIFIPILSVILATGVFFAGFFVRQATLDEGLQTLIRIKNMIQNEYYETVTDEAFYNALFDAVNENLLDDYSYYMTSEEYAQARTDASGAKSGIGLVLYTGGENVRIARVTGNSPAEKAGILSGDIITRYGVENALQEATTTEAFTAFVKSLDTGVSITLEVQRADETTTLSLSKQAYAEGYVFYSTNASAYRCTGEKALDFKEGGLPLSALADDTAYIRLTAFNGDASKQFDNAMIKFKADGKKKLVLDLRANGGGYMDILQDIAKYFCKNSKKLLPLIAVADYGEKQQKYYASANDYAKFFGEDSQIYVLADSGSASASEVLLGTMLDYGATLPENVFLVSRGGVAKTFGKGIMQTTYPFGLGNGQDAIKLTTAKLFWPVSGKCIHGRGYLPDDGARTIESAETDDQEIQNAIMQIQ